MFSHYNFILVVFVVVVVLLPLPSLAQTSLYVNPKTGLDTTGCGLVSTSPCVTLGYTLQLVLLQTGAVTIVLQFDVDGETITFSDTRTTTATITIQPSAGQWSISNSVITLQATVSLNNIYLDTTTLNAWALSTTLVVAEGSTLNAVPYLRVPSTISLSSSSFANSFVVLEQATIFGSLFENTPVNVTTDVCSASYSFFTTSATLPALTVHTCTIVGSDFLGNQAGGLYATGAVTINSADFSENAASAIYTEGSLNLYGVTLFRNSAVTGGAIFFNAPGATLIVNNSEIAYNSATKGGGIFLTGAGITLLSDNSFIDKNAADNGGGIAVVGASATVNWVNGGAALANNANVKGGALYVESSTVTFTGFAATLNNGAAIGEDAYLLNSVVKFTSASFFDGSGVYAENTVLDIQNGVFYQTAITLRNSSSLVPQWNAHFVFPATLSTSLDCDNCGNTLCKAANGCGECSGGCLVFADSSVCPIATSGTCPKAKSSAPPSASDAGSQTVFLFGIIAAAVSLFVLM